MMRLCDARACALNDTRRSMCPSHAKRLALSKASHLALVLAVLAGALPMSRAGSAVARPQSDMRTIAAAIDLHVLDFGVLPNDLLELVKAGYLDGLKDPWSRDYLYSQVKPVVDAPDQPFYIWTLGQDGLPGGEGSCADLFDWHFR